MLILVFLRWSKKIKFVILKKLGNKEGSMVANAEGRGMNANSAYPNAAAFYQAIPELTRGVEAHTADSTRVAAVLRDNSQYFPQMTETARMDMQELHDVVITHLQDFGKDDVLIELFNSALTKNKM